MTRTELEQGDWQKAEDWIEAASPADIRDVLNYTECLAIHWPGGATWSGGNRAQLVAAAKQMVRKGWKREHHVDLMWR